MADGTLLIETPVHGRVLWRAPEERPVAGLLVGFHGYGEQADLQMERLATVPGAARWGLASVQALNRFYRPRSQEVVASWMTRQDRDAAIADNLRYVDAAVDAVHHACRSGQLVVVYAGFSQGAPMAFRAAVHGRARCGGVIAVGGEIAPELLAEPGARFPPVVLVRGTRDEWYSQAKLDADVAALEARRVAVRAVVFDGGHEWSGDAAQAAGELLAAVHEA
jgi:predicted esterase